MGIFNRLGKGFATVALVSTLFNTDLPPPDRCRTQSVMPDYTIQTTSPDQRAIGKILAALENVPDSLQRRANENGQVVIVNRPVDVEGLLLGIPEFPEGLNEVEYTDEGLQVGVKASYTGSGETLGKITQTFFLDNEIRIRDTTVLGLGAYNPFTRHAIIPQHQNGIIEDKDIPLHEYGHLLDGETNHPSTSPEFYEVYRISGERSHGKLNPTIERAWRSKVMGNGKGGYVWADDKQKLTRAESRQLEAFWKTNEYISSRRGLRYPVELWAGVFSAYYSSSESRGALRIFLPEAYNFIRSWEGRYAKGCG